MSNHRTMSRLLWAAVIALAAALGCAKPCPRTRPPVNADIAANADIERLRRAESHWKLRRTDRHGNMPMLPSDDILEAMADCKIDELEVTLLVCIGEDGRVSGAAVMQPSRFAAWDETVRRAVGEHRYVPYEEDHIPRKICFPRRQAFRLDRL